MKKRHEVVWRPLKVILKVSETQQRKLGLEERMEWGKGRFLASLFPQAAVLSQYTVKGDFPLCPQI